MKKWIGGILGLTALLFLGTGIYERAKGTAEIASAVSIIGGADGPTSIFLAGKIGPDFSLAAIIVGICLLAAAVVLVTRK